MINIEDKLCTGCTMCGQICPMHAISFEIRDGFRFPVVDMDSCIECHLCEKKCPAIGNNIPKNPYPVVYSAWTKNNEQRNKCTSGGVCYEISKRVIEDGGYVCGVAWSDRFKNAEYIIAHSLAELELITQTKYFQPEMNDIFIKVRELLTNGEKVLFTGTSCSNAALLSFLDKKYDNLICLDFICRGYTSQLYHKKRIEDLETKEHSKISFVQYKEKSIGWEKFGTRFSFENGNSVYVNRDDDPYEYMLQINDYLTRMSCFECKYRTAERVSDITLGDFWGIKDLSTEDYISGVSAVLVNSDKGTKLFDEIADCLNYEKRSVWDTTRGNHCLLGQLKFYDGREKFYYDLDKLSIEELHDRYGNIKKYKTGKKRMAFKKTIKIILQLDLISFIHYNFLCKKVHRDKGKYIFPYRGSKISLDYGANIYIHGNMFLNIFKHKMSREETYLHVYKNGKMTINGRARIAAGSTIDVLNEAELDIGQSETNFGTVIVCSNKIVIGDGVEMGRNVIIYDSNFHPTQFNENIKGKPLVIGNHVWLCTGVCIAKGVSIGDGAICGINATVVRNVKERTSVMGNPAKCIMENVSW